MKKTMKFNVQLFTTFCFTAILVLKVSSQNSSTFFKQNELWGLKNSKGVQIIAPKFTNEFSPEFYFANNSYALVEINKKFGFVDRVGKEVVPIQYDDVSGHHFGDYLQVKKNQKWGLLDISTLKEVTDFIYDSLYFHSSTFNDSEAEDVGFYEVVLLHTRIGGHVEDGLTYGGSWGMIEVSKKGFKEILPCSFDAVNVFTNYFLVEKEGAWGAYSRDSKLVIPMIYNYLDFIPHMNCFVANQGDGKKKQNSSWYDDFHFEGGKWGLLNEKGEILIPFEFSYFRPKPNRERDDSVSVELIKVGNNGKYGLIDLKGKFRIPMVYDEIDDNIYSYNDFMDFLPYHDENYLVKVKVKDKWGMVSLENKVIIPIDFDTVNRVGDYYEVIGKGTFKLDAKGNKLDD